MIDFHSSLVAALKTVLPTHYEMTLTQGAKVPCISYMELNNSVDVNGDTLGYSRITYQVKIWGHDIAELQGYAILVDAILRPLGFRRISSNELHDRNSTMIQKILVFEALAKEEF